VSLTFVAENTQATTVGTLHTLSSPAGPGVYVLTVDVSALAADERLELRAQVKVLTGGTFKTYLMTAIDGPPSSEDAVYESVPVTAYYGCIFTLKQVNGLSRSFPWHVDQL
jgi:hypothetical protein